MRPSVQLGSGHPSLVGCCARPTQYHKRLGLGLTLEVDEPLEEPGSARELSDLHHLAEQTT